MTPQQVRAVLAYVMTAAVVVCLLLVAFVTLDQLQSTLVGSVLGAVLTNWKVPLAYYYDGVALKEQPADKAPAPDDKVPKP